jgi:uncharacterized protein YllA (UPF0747 family)
MRPKDFIRVIDTINKNIALIRKQLTFLERSRLQDNFNKVPKDIAYLTKSEADLKREMCLCIEEGEEYLVAQKNELQRLRREHLENQN